MPTDYRMSSRHIGRRRLLPPLISHLRNSCPAAETHNLVSGAFYPQASGRSVVPWLCMQESVKVPHLHLHNGTQIKSRSRAANRCTVVHPVPRGTQQSNGEGVTLLGDCIDRHLRMYTSRPGAKNAGCWGKLPLEEKLHRLRSFVLAVDIFAAWLHDKHRTIEKGMICCFACSEVEVWLHKM